MGVRVPCCLSVFPILFLSNSISIFFFSLSLSPALSLLHFLTSFFPILSLLFPFYFSVLPSSLFITPLYTSLTLSLSQSLPSHTVLFLFSLSLFLMLSSPHCSPHSAFSPITSPLCFMCSCPLLVNPHCILSPCLPCLLLYHFISIFLTLLNLLTF